MNNNELPQEYKELIAKIDERLKQLGLITDNKYPDEEPNPEVIKFYDRYFKKADNEQQSPVEWKVGEWAWSGKSNTMLSLITAFEDKLALVNNQNGLIECWDIDLMVKPTKEEIEQHLTRILISNIENKNKVSVVLSDDYKQITATFICK